MSRKPVDDITQRNLNSCKSTIYYKLYPDIYKRDSPLLNNYATRGEHMLPSSCTIPPGHFESAMGFNIQMKLYSVIPMHSE